MCYELHFVHVLCEMEGNVKCHRTCPSAGQIAVKFTAAFSLFTLFHTLFVLNQRGLLYSDYLTFKVHPDSDELTHNDERGVGDAMGDFNDGRTQFLKHQLRFPKEEAEDKDSDIQHAGNNSSQTSYNDDLETFFPKRAYSPLGMYEISAVEKFVFFVGYGRSGHSIVGSLLDAHPNVIIAHEYNLFRRWKGNMYQNRSFLYNELYRNSYNNAEKGWRNSMKNQKGYTLAVKESWQGSFQKLVVVGDKSGAVTTQTYNNDPLMFLEILKELRNTVKVPIRVIHVVRNPYDLISTRLLYADGNTRKTKVEASVDMKHVSPGNLSQHVNRTIHLVQNVHELLSNCSLTTLDVHLADLVLNPEHVMNNLCMFIGIKCSRDYLRKCSDKIYNRQSQTRYLVEWPQHLIDKVYEMIIKPYQSFWRYSFSSD